LDTPKTLPLSLLPQLFTQLCDDICCGLFVVEILRNGSGNPSKFVGRFANQRFCKLLSVSENNILNTELPESLSQTLDLPALVSELTVSGETRIQKNISLDPTQTCTLQAHLPCPELLTIAIQDTNPDRTKISNQAEVILANMGEPCTIIGKDFSVLYENEAAKELWGSNIGKKCHTAYHSLPSRCEPCHAVAVFTDGNIHKNEKAYHSNGSERHLEVTSAPLRDAAGKITAVVNINHDITVRKMSEKGKEHLIRELQASLAKTKRLNGLLPICSYCKKIKDNNGAWQQLESYLRSHAEVEFSHGICHECGEKHHPEAFIKKK